MAKSSSKRITGVKATTVATYQGTFAAILGLGVAILYSLQNTIDMAESTDSVLTGMAFGLAIGVVSIIVLPMIYFAFGWLIGLFNGWVFNVVAESSGGIVVEMSDEN